MTIRIFDDNALAQVLFGEHNCNIAILEEALNVEIATRGNEVKCKGSDSKIALSALDALYQRLQDGLTVSAQDVKAAIRFKNAEKQVNQHNIVIKTKKKTLSPRSPQQSVYIKALADKDMVFGIGPAGTGKTYLAVAKGVEAIINGEVDRIILSRPAVEAGEQLGFLPGDLKMKIDPYLRPLYDALYDTLPAEMVDKKLEAGIIEIAPLAFMRGRTLQRAYVILDEAQNATEVQLKMFLTRMGDGSKMVITGDPSQVDLPKKVPSGLTMALNVANDIPEIDVIRFSEADVVRHPLVGKIIAGYKKHNG